MVASPVAVTTGGVAVSAEALTAVDVSYPVPAELIRGKTAVTVKFVAKSARNGVGPVSGVIRMVRVTE